MKKALIKTVTWRILASISTFVIIYVITKNITFSFGVSIFEISFKMILYYLHEKYWEGR